MYDLINSGVVKSYQAPSRVQFCFRSYLGVELRIWQRKMFDNRPTDVCL
jgi:hypothetical protein